MFVTIDENRICVTLSRRNLHQLEALLDNPAAAHTCLARKDDRGVALVVQAQDDANHYDGRDPGPGVGKSPSPPRQFWKLNHRAGMSDVNSPVQGPSMHRR